MRFWTAAACLGLVGANLVGTAAWAQDQTPTVVVPPAPAIVATPAPAPSAPVPPTAPAVPPAGLAQTPAPATPATAAPDVAPALDNSWQPGTNAILGVLDKVNGGASQISIAVGAQTTIGDLAVSVQSCLVRPPAAIPDSAVFLTVQSTADGSSGPLFRGWMVRSLPAAAVVGDAGELFRVIGCS